MKSGIFVIILSLCFPFFCKAQSVDLSTVTGYFQFERAEFTGYRHGSAGNPLTVVKVENVNGLDTAGFHFERIFRTMDFSGGVAVVTLGGRYDGLVYHLSENQLVLVDKKSEEKEEEGDTEGLTPIAFPPYTYMITGNQLILSYTYPYGDSDYAFPMEGTMTVTYTKQ